MPLPSELATPPVTKMCLATGSQHIPEVGGDLASRAPIYVGFREVPFPGQPFTRHSALASANCRRASSMS
jgi:hypothetical protein